MNQICKKKLFYFTQTNKLQVYNEFNTYIQLKVNDTNY